MNPGKAGEQVYTFSQRNLLTGTQLGAGSSVYDTIVEYVYDGDGHRLQQVDHSGSQPITTTYTNDNSGLSQVLVSDDGTTQTHNLLGLSLIHQDDGSQTRILLADGLGSVRVEMVGEAIDSATTYEPYGKLLARSGASGTVYGYTGEQHDAATGLVYLRARYYNPNLKLFMSRDPFPGWQTVPASQHGYSYVHNNPVNLTDPSGEFVPLILGGLIIGAVTGVTWDVMVNQGKGGLDNLHNILNPHYYCDVNWGQAGFTGAVGSVIGAAVGAGAAVVTKVLRPIQVPIPDIPDPLNSHGRRIADGHAYDKHVVERGEFPEINDRREFADYIDDIIQNPDEDKALNRGRHAYWKDDTVVITDPSHQDGGTAFRPRDGKEYYESQLD